MTKGLTILLEMDVSNCEMFQRENIIIIIYLLLSPFYNRGYRIINHVSRDTGQIVEKRVPAIPPMI